MDAGVFGEFGVESGGHRASLPDCDWNFIFAFGGDYFDLRAELLDLRGADEDHLERRARIGVERALHELAFADGAVELASVGVATDADVDGSEAGLLGIFDFGGE